MFRVARRGLFVANMTAIGSTYRKRVSPELPGQPLLHGEFSNQPHITIVLIYRMRKPIHLERGQDGHMVLSCICRQNGGLMTSLSLNEGQPGEMIFRSSPKRMFVAVWAGEDDSEWAIT